MNGEPTLHSLRPHFPRSPGLVAALVLITLLAAAARWPGLSEPLWVDELHTGWVVADGGHELFERARAGNQSPLYFLAPWLCQTVVGPREIALRAPSLLAGLLLPLAAWWCARQAGAGRNTALIAALLIALDPRSIFYAQEARGYALVQLVAIMHLGWLVAQLREGRSGRYRIAWIVTGVLLFYLHYTTALVLIAESLALAIAVAMPRGDVDPPRDARGWFCDMLLMAVACVPELPTVLAVAKRRDNWSHMLTADTFRQVFDWRAFVLAPLLALALVTALRKWQRRQPLLWRPNHRVLLALASWIVAPVALAELASHTGGGPLLLYRYVLASATALALVPASLAAVVPGRLGAWLIGGTAVLLVTLTPGPVEELLRYGQVAAARGEDWREVARLVRTHVRGHHATGEPLDILLCPALVEDWRLPAGDASLASFCRFPLRSIYSVPQSVDQIHPLPTIDGPRLDAATTKRLLATGRAWLVTRGDSSLEHEVLLDLSATVAKQRRRLLVEPIYDGGGVQLSLVTVE